jgi:hypothetical protein
VLLCLSACRSMPVAAQDESQVRAAAELSVEGRQAFERHAFAKAVAKFDQAYKLLPAPTVGLWSARARAKLGKLLLAEVRYREVLRSPLVGDPEVQREAQAQAKEELSALRSRIPVLIITNDRPSLPIVVHLDGVLVSKLDSEQQLDPGTHQVVAERNSERRTFDMTLVEGERQTLHVAIEPVAKPPAAVQIPPQQSVSQGDVLDEMAQAPPETHDSNHSMREFMSIAAISLGGVSLAVSGVAALVASGKCPGGRCRAADELDRYTGLRTGSEVCFYTGLGLVALGVTTLLLEPSRDDESVALRVGMGGIAMSGAF